MSIDQRLRTGLRTEADQVPDLVALLEGWADVEARAEHQRNRDRARWVVGIAAAVVLLAAAAVTWWPRSDGDVQPIAPPPSPSASTSGPSALEGSWTTGPVPAQGILDHLESVGLGQWGEAVLQDTPANATIEYRLKLQGGRSTHTLAVNGGEAVIQDVQTYEIDGSRVTLTVEDGSCSDVLAWEVKGDRLRLRVLDDGCPPYRGTPDVAMVHGLYVAFPFTRSGS